MYRLSRLYTKGGRAVAECGCTYIFTSTKEVMFLPGFVCGFVCEHDNSKTYGRILMKFSGYV